MEHPLDDSHRLLREAFSLSTGVPLLAREA